MDSLYCVRHNTRLCWVAGIEEKEDAEELVRMEDIWTYIRPCNITFPISKKLHGIQPTIGGST